jgi:GNAT superfamily N-acetyltransferase
MFSIIHAKLQYLPEIYTMILDHARHEGIFDKIHITESQLKQVLFCDNPIHFAALAMGENGLSGFVMYNITHHNVCVNVSPGIYVDNIFVLPQHRSQGIGTALFRHVAEAAKDMNISRIEWWVSKHNHDAQHFYDSIGADQLNNWKIYKAGKVCIDRLLS